MVSLYLMASRLSFMGSSTMRALKAEGRIISAHALPHIITMLSPEAKWVLKHLAQRGPQKAGKSAQTSGSTLGKAK